MSKFTDKLQQIYQGGAAPSIGFRKPTDEGGKQLLAIVANLTRTKATKTKDITNNINAGIVSSESFDAESFKQLASTMGDVPLGLSLESADPGDISKFIDSGCDFIVFDLKTPLAVIKQEGAGKILKVEPSLDPGLARTINELQLPIDGVLVPSEESSVTIEHLLICQRFADLLGKPLLTTINSPLTSEELSSLYEARVNGLILPEGLPVKTFVELKNKIGSLPKSIRRKSGGTALLPRLGGEPEAAADEEEEDFE